METETTAAPTETAAETPAAPQQDNDARARQFLARQEREIAERRESLNAREREAERIAARERELSELYSGDEFDIIERFAKKRGLDGRGLIKRAVHRVANGGPLSPDLAAEDARREAQQAREETRQLREEIARRERAAREAEHARHAQSLLEGYQSRTLGALSDERHPALCAESRADVARAALRVANEYARRTGEIPDASAVLDYLEQRADQNIRPRFEKHAARLGYTKEPPPDPDVRSMSPRERRAFAAQKAFAAKPPVREAREPLVLTDADRARLRAASGSSRYSLFAELSRERRAKKGQK